MSKEKALLEAVSNEDKAKIELLLKEGVSINIQDEDKDGVLHYALYALKIEFEMVRFLIERNADFSLANQYQETALHLAITRNAPKEIVNLLLEVQAKKYHHTNAACFATLLHQIAFEGNVAELLKFTVLEKSQVNQKDAAGFTPLHYAAARGHQEIVACLLLQGAEVDAQSESGRTPLILAARNGHVELVKQLLEKKSSLKLADKNGSTALYLAAWWGYADVVQILAKPNVIPVKDARGWKMEFKSSPLLHAKTKLGETALQVACKNGHASVVKLLLEYPADPSEPNQEQMAFKLAVQKGHLKVIDVFLSLRSKLFTEKDEEGKTILHWAVEYKSHAVVRHILLIKTVERTVFDKGNQTPLYYAVKQQDLVLIDLLLSQGVSNEVRSRYEGKIIDIVQMAAFYGYREILEQALKGRWKPCENKEAWASPLFMAAEGGQYQIVEWLLSQGADVNAMGSEVGTALHIASSKGHLDIVNLLLDKSAVEINGTNKLGFTALYTAVDQGHTAVVKAILKKEQEIAKQIFDKGKKEKNLQPKEYQFDYFNDKHSFIHYAGDKNHYGTADEEAKFKQFQLDTFRSELRVEIQTLKARFSKNTLECSSCNTPNKDGWMPLHWAASKGYKEIVQCLLDYGANIHATLPSGENTLHLASENGHLEVVKILLETEPAIEIAVINTNGQTALHFACSNGYTPILSELIKKEKDDSFVNMKDENGWTSLHYACKKGDEEVVRFLLTHPKIQINAKDKQNWTPLHYAVFKGYEGIVRVLLQHNADVSAKTEKGRTPLQLAIHCNQWKLVLIFKAVRQLKLRDEELIELDRNFHHYQSLKDFDLSNNEFGDEAIKILIKRLGNSSWLPSFTVLNFEWNLSSLDLSGNSLGGGRKFRPYSNAQKLFYELTGNVALEKLNFANNKLNQWDIDSLKWLLDRNTTLTSVELWEDSVEMLEAVFDFNREQMKMGKLPRMMVKPVMELPAKAASPTKSMVFLSAEKNHLLRNQQPMSSSSASQVDSQPFVAKQVSPAMLQLIPKLTNKVMQLLAAIGENQDDSKKLGNIFITRKEVANALLKADHSSMDFERYYTNDFIHILLHSFNTGALPIESYAAIRVEELKDYHQQIQSTGKTHIFIPLNVSYEKGSKDLNHWIGLIVDKANSCIFYLDPAQKTEIPQEVKDLQAHLHYYNAILTSPIDFQSKEKEQGQIVHCAVYLIQIFKVFKDSIQNGKTITDSETLKAALGVIPCGEGDAVVFRIKHIHEAYQLLVGDLEHQDEMEEMTTSSAARPTVSSPKVDANSPPTSTADTLSQPISSNSNSSATDLDWEKWEWLKVRSHQSTLQPAFIYYVGYWHDKFADKETVGFYLKQFKDRKDYHQLLSVFWEGLYWGIKTGKVSGKQLILSGCGLEQDIFVKGLERLSFVNGLMRLSPQFQPLDQFKELQHLDLSGNKIGGFGIGKLFNWLKEIKQLQSLNLSGNPLDQWFQLSYGVDRLSEALSTFSSLQTLILAECRLWLGGIKLLADIIQKHPALTHVNFNGNGLTNDAAKKLGKLLRKSNLLKELHLAENAIENEGVIGLLEGLNKSNSLTELTLTPKGVDLCFMASAPTLSTLPQSKNNMYILVQLAKEVMPIALYYVDKTKVNPTITQLTFLKDQSISTFTTALFSMVKDYRYFDIPNLSIDQLRTITSITGHMAHIKISEDIMGQIHWKLAKNKNNLPNPASKIATEEAYEIQERLLLWESVTCAWNRYAEAVDEGKNDVQATVLKHYQSMADRLIEKLSPSRCNVWWGMAIPASRTPNTYYLIKNEQNAPWKLFYVGKLPNIFEQPISCGAINGLEKVLSHFSTESLDRMIASPPPAEVQHAIDAYHSEKLPATAKNLKKFYDVLFSNLEKLFMAFFCVGSKFMETNETKPIGWLGKGASLIGDAVCGVEFGSTVINIGIHGTGKALSCIGEFLKFIDKLQQGNDLYQLSKITTYEEFKALSRQLALHLTLLYQQQIFALSPTIPKDTSKELPDKSSVKRSQITHKHLKSPLEEFAEFIDAKIGLRCIAGEAVEDAWTFGSAVTRLSNLAITPHTCMVATKKEQAMNLLKLDKVSTEKTVYFSEKKEWLLSKLSSQTAAFNYVTGNFSTGTLLTNRPTNIEEFGYLYIRQQNEATSLQSALFQANASNVVLFPRLHLLLQKFLGGSSSRTSLELTTSYPLQIVEYFFKKIENHAQCIQVMFTLNEKNPIEEFKMAVEKLASLSNDLKHPAVFMSSMPDKKDHFICGFMKDKELLLINPLGEDSQCPSNFCDILSELQEKGSITWFGVSKIRLHKPTVYAKITAASSAPIVLELIRHFLADAPEAFEKDWTKLKATTKEENSILVLLEPSLLLFQLHKEKNEFSYQQTLIEIRQLHYEMLQQWVHYDEEEKCLRESEAQRVFNTIMSGEEVTQLDKLNAKPQLPKSTQGLSLHRREKSPIEELRQQLQEQEQKIEQLEQSNGNQETEIKALKATIKKLDDDIKKLKSRQISESGNGVGHVQPDDQAGESGHYASPVSQSGQRRVSNNRNGSGNQNGPTHSSSSSLSFSNS